jgi:hypothetical protein
MKKFKAAILLPFAFFASSCACWQPEHKNDLACVVLHQTLDCTKDAVMSLVPRLLPVVSWVIGGANGTMDWSQSVKTLEAMGVDASTCTLAQLENDFLVVKGSKEKGLTSANPLKLSASNAASHHKFDDELLGKSHKVFQEWFVKNHPDIKVRVKLADGTTRDL